LGGGTSNIYYRLHDALNFFLELDQLPSAFALGLIHCPYVIIRFIRLGQRRLWGMRTSSRREG